MTHPPVGDNRWPDRRSDRGPGGRANKCCPGRRMSIDQGRAEERHCRHEGEDDDPNPSAAGWTTSHDRRLPAPVAGRRSAHEREDQQPLAKVISHVHGQGAPGHRCHEPIEGQHRVGAEEQDGAGGGGRLATLVARTTMVTMAAP